MQTLLLEELSVKWRDSVKMPWFCNRTQRECVCMFLGGMWGELAAVCIRLIIFGETLTGSDRATYKGSVRSRI